MPDKPKQPSRQRTPRAAQSNSIHELEITLLDVAPRVWRRFTVPGSMSLAKLHEVIQIVMGWTDSHLHQFVTGDGARYASPSPFGDPDWDEQVTDAATIRVSNILATKGAELSYEYDFGDGWEHRVEVVTIRPPQPGEKTPRCLAGERNCPPEDCGGPYGYVDLLAALADPKHPDHADMAEWIGDEFDAELFDLNEVNEMLAEIR